MSHSYELTPEMTNELKCSLCDNILSVPPISIISEDATKYKCGRCQSIKTYIETRCYMYERLAKHITFPCIFEGCTEKLGWPQVREHEKKCVHRKISCPKLNCDMKIGPNDIATHFQEKHKEAYHVDSLVVTNVNNYYSLDLLQKNDKLYIVIFDYNDTVYGISVCSFEPDNHQYELTLDSDLTRQSIIVSGQNIVLFDEKTHCFKCINGVCKSEFHHFRYYKNGILKRMTTKLDKDFVSRTLRGQPMNYRLNIVEEKVEGDEDLDDLVKDMVVDEVNDEEDDDNVEMSIDEKLVRRLLQCPNCADYMQAPIYQCVAGHTICGKCKTQVDECPNCKTKIEATRNYVLEDVANHIKVPSSANGNEVETKEITCPQAHCFDQFELSAIGTHFKDKHTEHYHWDNFTIRNMYSYFYIDVLIKGSKTYLVLFDHNMPNFLVSVCSISGHDDCRYEVKLVSQDGKLATVATDQKIVPFEETKHCFKCISGACKDEKHKYRFARYSLFKRFTTKFNRESILSAFGHKKLNYVVKIIDQKTVFLKELERKKDKLFRQLYECPICKDYMFPPIQQCVAGHVICSTCKDKVEKCPSCEGAYTGTRNYTLEDVVDDVVLPCQFVTENCPVRAGIKRIASHETECPLSKKKLRVEPEQEQDVEQTE